MTGGATMSRRVVFASLIGLLVASEAQAAKLRVVFKDETEIEGEVQKPEVAVFITRQNLNKAYELELKESFLPKILESIEHPPF